MCSEKSPAVVRKLASQDAGAVSTQHVAGDSSGCAHCADAVPARSASSAAARDMAEFASHSRVQLAPRRARAARSALFSLPRCKNSMRVTGIVLCAAAAAAAFETPIKNVVVLML